MAAENNTEAGFTIDGSVYPLPEIDSLTMDERDTLYGYCQLVQEDFAPLEGEDDDEHEERVLKLTRHPGFLRALMHIAYARAHPKLPAGRVRDLVGAAVFVEAVETLDVGDGPEAEEDPTPELTSELGESSPRNSDGSSRSSGPPSIDDTAAPVDRPVLTSVGNSQRSESSPTPSES